MIKFKKNLLIGIDFGTAVTKVYVQEAGMIEELPTVIALNKRTRGVLAIGEDAKKMIGRNPMNIDVIRPVLRGVIVHFDEALIFLENVLEKIKRDYFSFFGNKLIIGVPLDLTEVQKKGVIDVGLGSGAKEVYLIEEPLAAALGANLDVEEAKGILIVDIGGGTTDIALISLGGVVLGKSIRIGGDTFNEDIIDYLKSKFGLLIGEGQAEEAKIKIGSIVNNRNELFLIKGRDILTGLPKEIHFTSQHLRESISEHLDEITNTLKDIVNLAPPDLLSDISQYGVYLTGGGSLIHGLSNFLEKEIKLKINLVDEPRYAVIRGIGKVLEDFNHYYKYLINV
ncbi:MAG: rod shape-determining protein [Candidatus Parcubacteria bacterium]|nr:MAG: rod shape-determining protein [Candidatus Parcubacteria bacterium]